MDEVWLHSEYVTPDYAISAAPLLGVTRSVLLQGFSFSSEQWNLSVNTSSWTETRMFQLRDCQVGENCCGSIANLCRRAKVSELDDVIFEDFGKFCRAFIENSGGDEEGCQMLWFWNDSAKNHRFEILELSKKLGWRVSRDTGEDITIVNFPENTFDNSE